MLREHHHLPLRSRHLVGLMCGEHPSLISNQALLQQHRQNLPNLLQHPPRLLPLLQFLQPLLFHLDLLLRLRLLFPQHPQKHPQFLLLPNPLFPLALPPLRLLDPRLIVHRIALRLMMHQI